MILRINHETIYRYNAEIFLEPQYLHFFPQAREYLHLRQFHIEMDPTPDNISHRLDAENNTMIQCLFSKECTEFKINAQLELEIQPFNPFNFFLEDSVTKKAEDQKVLEAYMTPLEAIPEKLRNWISNKTNGVVNNPVDMLSLLTAEVHDGWDHSPRYKKDLLSPEVCFDRKSGSCRDLSWMLIHFLRYLNIPARFVSGYSFNDELGEGHELHAWVEAWLPGAGWVGLDPSSGLWTSEIYIPIVTSYEPQRTMPVTGSYRGKAQSTLETSVQIQEI